MGREHFRVVVTFSPDESEATVTTEVFDGTVREGALVCSPETPAESTLVALALERARYHFPTLF